MFAAFIVAEVLLALGFRRLAREPVHVPPPRTGTSAPSTPKCLPASLFAATPVPPAPVFNVLNEEGQAVLEGASLYLTPAGQDAVMGRLTEWVLTPPAGVVMTRQSAVRMALVGVFPECTWWIPVENFTAEQYQAWLSATKIAAALEADAGKSLVAAPRTGSRFIHRGDIGLGSATIGGLPVGTTIVLNASDASGDNAEIVMAEVTGPVDQNFTQDVLISAPVGLGDVHGVLAGETYQVSTPWQTMAILQQPQPNPRLQNPVPPHLFYPLLGR